MLVREDEERGETPALLKTNGAAMYDSMGPNTGGDESFQSAKKAIFIQCFGAPPRPVSVEMPKPWVCTLCPRGHQPAFTTRGLLGKHEEEAHPFQCPVCSKRFDDNKTRAEHMRRTHQPDGFCMDMARQARGVKKLDSSWQKVTLISQHIGLLPPAYHRI